MVDQLLKVFSAGDLHYSPLALSSNVDNLFFHDVISIQSYFSCAINGTQCPHCC